MKSPAPPSPLVWEDGAPRSALYGDIYYSLQDGLAETRTVFLEGCGLPQAWAGRDRFVVAELGFGSGLNIAALLDLWNGTRATGGHLHIFSTEAHPISREDAARALGTWPELSAAAEALLDQWPGVRRGVHRIDLPGFSATVDVAVMDVAQALEQWDGRADAWFLDGFSPATNPAMWRDEVLALVAARSAPGARVATFTVAGQVRRGLEANGLTIAKRPGHGRKRERLEAYVPGEPPVSQARPKVVVIGGGIAGASLARAFRALKIPVQVLTHTEAVAASGNPAALVTPALDAGGGPRAAFYAQAFARAIQLYGAAPGGVIASGALQIQAGPRDASRFAAVMAQDIFEPASLQPHTAGAIGETLGEPALAAGFEFRDAVVVEPARVLETWLDDDAVQARVTAVEPAPRGWRIVLDGAAKPIEADIVVIAAGWGAAGLAGDLRLSPVRGQASWAAGTPCGQASAFSAYAIPTPTGTLFGATHDRERTDTGEDPGDHAKNLQALAARRPNLAGAIDLAAVAGRAAIRVATPDRLPAAGRIADGLFILTGLGSRGFTTAPLLAEHIAALSLRAPSPLGRELAGLVDPLRLRGT